MKLEDFEYRTGKSRHYEVKKICEQCKEEFWAKWIRVKEGKGRFCSRKCYQNYTKNNAARQGKEFAFFYWRENQNCWAAGWYDEDGKQHRTTKARWLWEMNYGEIPKNMIVTYIDKNPKNCELENLKLITQSEANSVRLIGHYVSDETKKKIGKVHKGKSLSEEHRKKIGDRSRELWARGRFDAVHYGEHNHHWRGGVYGKYPKEFNEKLKMFIKDRDNYACVICKKQIYRSKYAHIHHIDRDKENNDPSNLILVCFDCHNKIHSSNNDVSDDILAFRSQLVKEDKEEYMI